jgi:hypothetical protein
MPYYKRSRLAVTKSSIIEVPLPAARNCIGTTPGFSTICRSGDVRLKIRDTEAGSDIGRIIIGVDGGLGDLRKGRTCH